MQWGNVSNLIAITDHVTGRQYTYRYNDQGIRTEKVVNGVVHKYYLQGEQIIAERYGNNLIKFYYDTTGVCGFRYYNKWADGNNSNGTDYYYLKNIFGDILGIYDDSGNVCAEYSYDAWGRCTIKGHASDFARMNPFRYRGYYYDRETGWYYLNSRYYDPEVGRFISADTVEYLNPAAINGLNLYAYCNNNPVMYTDPYGTTAWWEWLIGGLIVVGLAVGSIVTGGAVAAVLAGAAIGAAISYGTQAISGELNWGQFALDIGVGALSGAIGASGVSQATATVLGGLIGSGSSIASDLINGNSVNWGKAAISGVIGIAAGFLGGAGVNNVRGLSFSIYKGFSKNLTVGIVSYVKNNSAKYFFTVTI